MRKIVPVVNKMPLKELDEKQRDFDYWQQRTPAERVAAVTLLIRQTMHPGQRMDKTVCTRRKLHP